MHKSEVPVRSSCGQAWAEMEGDALRRFCATCQHDVVNLSVLTEKEVAALVARAGAERVCVRYEVDHEDQIVFLRERRAASPGLRGRIAGGALAVLTRGAAPLIPVSALLSACAATQSSAPSPGCPLPGAAPTQAAACDPQRASPSETDLPYRGSGAGIAVLVQDIETRKPLGDVVVTLTGSALRGEQTAVTNTHGRAVLPDLPPGDGYSVRFDKDGYRPHRAGVGVRSGQIETVQAALSKEAPPPDGKEVIVGVIVVPAVIDVGSSSTSQKIDKEFIQRVPLR